MKFPKIMWLTIGALSACSRPDELPVPPAPELQSARNLSEGEASTPSSEQIAESAIERLEQIAGEVSAWRAAPDLATAKSHAEAARNLIVGPAGPGYGDANEDGRASGANAIGLLPATLGRAALAVPAANPCVTRDLLGGSWDNPARRWAILQAKIAAWRPGNNTFPTLPSHAQRIVGWATLALGSSDLETAREYAVHAKLHVDVSRTAVSDC